MLKEMRGWRAAVNEAMNLLQKTETTIARLSQMFRVETNRQMLKQLLDMDLERVMEVSREGWGDQQQDGGEGLIDDL